MVQPATQKASRLARWWMRTRDVPEVMPLYACLAFAVGIAGYTTKKVYFNADAGSFVNVNTRGDPLAQAEATKLPEDPYEKKHSVFWHVAQIKVDRDGANVGVFDNRTRPHQYSKPGYEGTGAIAPQ
ncbi:hypothetical protein MNEG_8863 [Monoraphidium neglectum]|uniref:Uncharacterized protein n=1 Tax=Monoraphidium neglectum TaxID=145388 RepID=A0A0D2JID4_9CHLO|nr:hypothetical protein MNEG_8863 [Monoraphidium neglectum]KIY99097.1 hypothetical protein MNEG_8863 [Monoraphidium neglectum]|eukprot:XP_013898117.1 hypothetical protein MNEG_8863 [Monoraphidium neglectum]